MASIYNQHRAPQPTAAPPRHLVNARLGIRQDDSTTCGWAYNFPGSDGVSTGILALECSASWACAYNAVLGADGCCPIDQPVTDCVFQNTCYGYNGGPESLPSNAVTCTDPIYPNCGGIVFGDVTSFICVSETSLVIPGTVNPNIPPIITISVTAAPSTVLVTPVDESPIASPTQGVQTTPVNPQGAQPSSTSSSGSSGGLPTGAIAGIAVGGVAVILGLLALFFIMRRRAKKTARARQTMRVQDDLIATSQPRSATNTASWVSSQPAKMPQSSVAEYGIPNQPPHPPGGIHYAGGGPMYNDYDGMTVAGTIDHDAAPRI